MREDQFDVDLVDADLLDEVELTTDLMIAASGADHHLSTSEIDEALGLEPGQVPRPRRSTD